MPELPEVETVRRALEIGLDGLCVTAVRGRSVMMRRPLDVALHRIADRWRTRFISARRRGKYLLLDFDVVGTLMIHLGMSGRLLLCGAAEPQPDHTHLVLTLSDGRELRFVDPRRFGLAAWLEPGEKRSTRRSTHSGSNPSIRHGRSFPPLLHARRSPVKSLMLDQQLIAGVGNIYAAEALWRAGIRPTRKGSQISIPRLRRLAVETRRVIEEAVAEGGTTIRDYATPSGDFGNFAVKLQVYGKEGRPCPRCTTIKRHPDRGPSHSLVPQLPTVK